MVLSHSLEDSSRPDDIVLLTVKKNPINTAPTANPNQTLSSLTKIPIKKGNTKIYKLFNNKHKYNYPECRFP